EEEDTMAWLHEDVAGMGIGVEVPEVEDLDHHEVGATAGDAFRVEAVEAQACRFGDADALLVAHRQHAARGDGLVDAGAGAGAVELNDGGGGDGLYVEYLEEILERVAELGLDDGARLSEGEGGHVFLEMFELAYQLDGDEVRSRGQDLSDLDEGGTQLGERGA